jgi:hypothetical protein
MKAPTSLSGTLVPETSIVPSGSDRVASDLDGQLDALLPFRPRNPEVVHLARQHDPGPPVHQQSTLGDLNHRASSALSLAPP